MGFCGLCLVSFGRQRASIGRSGDRLGERERNSSPRKRGRPPLLPRPCAKTTDFGGVSGTHLWRLEWTREVEPHCRWLKPQRRPSVESQLPFDRAVASRCLGVFPCQQCELTGKAI